MLRLANGNTMCPRGFITLDIMYKNCKYNQKFYIYERLPFQFLLGLDFCKLSKLNINFDNISDDNSVYLKELSLFNIDIETNDNHLYCSTDVNITSFSGMWVTVSSHSDLPLQYLLCVCPRFHLKSPLIINNCINSSQDSNKSILFVINPTHNDVVLREGTKLGQFEPFIEQINCYHTEPDGQDTVATGTIATGSSVCRDGDSNESPIEFSIGDNLSTHD